MMTRSLLKPILMLATLWLAAAPAWGAQEPKPAPTEAVPAKPADAAKDAKPAAKAAPKAKPAPAPTKATPKKSAHAPNYMLGEAPPKPGPKAPVAPMSKPRKKTAKNPSGKWLDVNTASKEELKTLPGIFDAEADKIIAKRPYKSKAGLLVDAGLTGAQYFGIKDRVIAGQVLPKPK
jgi:DNA uptake protein ComE-like DNA-binding protein